MMLRIIFICLLFIAALGVNAQFSIGARGGYGSHGAHFEPPDLNNRQQPFYKANAGFVMVYNNTQNSGLQIEINYAQKGWMEQDTSYQQLVPNPYNSSVDTIIKPDSYFKRHVDYIEIPIYSHWEIGYGKFRPIIFAGPYVAWKIGDRTESLNYEWWWNDENQFLTYEQEIRDLDLGIKMGLGMRYNINKRFAIYIDARYDLQLAGGRDIFKDNPNKIQASRLKEISGSFGVLWHIIPQKKKEVKKGYVPKEDLFEAF